VPFYIVGYSIGNKMQNLEILEKKKIQKNQLFSSRPGDWKPIKTLIFCISERKLTTQK
jgi:hypothetical protein